MIRNEYIGGAGNQAVDEPSKRPSIIEELEVTNALLSHLSDAVNRLERKTAPIRMALPTCGQGEEKCPRATASDVREAMRDQNAKIILITNQLEYLIDEIDL